MLREKNRFEKEEIGKRCIFVILTHIFPPKEDRLKKNEIMYIFTVRVPFLAEDSRVKSRSPGCKKEKYKYNIQISYRNEQNVRETV